MRSQYLLNIVLLAMTGIKICIAYSLAKLSNNEMEKESRSLHRDKRSMLLSRLNSKWPGNIIPFKFDDTFNIDDIAQVAAAMTQWSKYTCIKFIPTLSESGDIIVFVNGSACGTYLGRNGGLQPVFLHKRCRIVPVIMHELGHVIGLFHEQQRPDRNYYVKIKDENILPNVNVVAQYTRQDRILATTLSIPYDYYSIMHYPRRSFSFTGEDTIITRDPKFQDVIGTVEDLSYFDVKRVNLYLGCAERCPEYRCPKTAFKDKNCVCMCEDPLRKLSAIPCDEVKDRKNKTGFAEEGGQSLGIDKKLNLEFSAIAGVISDGRDPSVSSASQQNPLSNAETSSDAKNSKTNPLYMLSEHQSINAVENVETEAVKFTVESDSYSPGRIFAI